jgi:molecular chaperone IbpA
MSTIDLSPLYRSSIGCDNAEVTGAELNNGLLTISLVKEIPEEMKPRKSEIATSQEVIEHQPDTDKAV